MGLMDFDSQPELHADPDVEQADMSEIFGFWTSRRVLMYHNQFFQEGVSVTPFKNRRFVER
jgi:hypothetical protein